MCKALSKGTDESSTELGLLGSDGDVGAIAAAHVFTGQMVRCMAILSGHQERAVFCALIRRDGRGLGGIESDWLSQ